MKTRFAPSSGIILVPRMELRTVEGLGIFHTLSETSAEMAYEGFPLISPQPHSPQYFPILTLGSLPYTQPTFQTTPGTLSHPVPPQIHQFTAPHHFPSSSRFIIYHNNGTSSCQAFEGEGGTDE